MNFEHSDVTFIVEGEKLPAHRIILAARSPYFQALFGGLAEVAQAEIKLDVPLEAFKASLKYAYTRCVSLNEMKEEHILDLLDLTELYGFGTLKATISTFLAKTLTLESCCRILERAKLYNSKMRIDVCLAFMDTNATELLSSSDFKTLSPDSLCMLLDRDTFHAPEINILNGVNKWYANNPNTHIEVISS